MLAATMTFAPMNASAQSAVVQAVTDSLIDVGRWSEAEDLLYAQSRTDPHDARARAALGRYLLMKGAVRPGLILIDEARMFGLPPALAAPTLERWGQVLSWRGAGSFGADSVVKAREGRDPAALFSIPLPRSTVSGDLVWADVVTRMIGTDSVLTSPSRIGLETLEHLVPSYEPATRRLVLSPDPRSALRAEGRRYQVLRDERGVRVLMGPGRVRSLAAALEEIAPRWWQLDLPHGFLVVR